VHGGFHTPRRVTHAHAGASPAETRTLALTLALTEIDKIVYEIDKIR
jgi:hypothetical protein